MTLCTNLTMLYSMSGERYMESDFYSDSAYTADISTRMRVPDRYKFILAGFLINLNRCGYLGKS